MKNAKATASPGSDNSGADLSLKDKQFKGKSGGKPVVNESASSGKDGLSARGMSSEEGARQWKKTGYKVPTSQAQNHKG